MNYGEEQKNELEALSEIYYNEIKVISDKPPISFSIKVRPQASNYEEPEMMNSDGEENEESDEEDLDDGDDDDEVGGENIAQQQDFCVELQFDLPPKYPEEKPSIQILDSQNLEEDELMEMMNNLNEKAEESLGTVMVFVLVSDVVEWLITKSEREADELEREKEEKLKELEAEETKKMDGTPVTEQTFLAWKAKFEAEMLITKIEQQKQQLQQNEPGVVGTRRLTGRAMFESDKTLAESDLADIVEELDQNQLEALLHNIEEVNLDDDENVESSSCWSGDEEEYPTVEDSSEEE